MSALTGLLIVECEVLQRTGDVVGMGTLDGGSRQHTCQ